MSNRSVYYVTNRNHNGKNRFRPTGYGSKSSGDGIENLRFGKATIGLDAKDEESIGKLLVKKTASGKGDGGGVTKKMTKWAGSAKLVAYKEKLDASKPDAAQSDNMTLGSAAMFSELRDVMAQGRDVLIFVHGFNVSFKKALGTALGLQEMVNRKAAKAGGRGDAVVVLFSWPSDGSMMPFSAYKSDRADAKASGYALGRAMLKLRDYLGSLEHCDYCGRGVSLLCHSMGNYVMQNALRRIVEFSPKGGASRILDQIFMCSPDVSDEVFEPGRKLERLHRIARNVTIYFNEGDTAMYISDYSKGNDDRLGCAGASKPVQLHRNVQQVDCSGLVTGVVEHSYFLDGRINTDIRQSLDEVPQDDETRSRKQAGPNNTWVGI